MKMNYSRPETGDIPIDYMPGATLALGPGVSPPLAAALAKSLTRAWLAMPPDERMAVARNWRSTCGWGARATPTPVGMLVLDRPNYEAKIYNPHGSMIFSQRQLAGLTPQQLEAEAAAALARVVFGADVRSIAAAVKRLERPASPRRPAPPEVVCPELTDLAKRRRWGLPDLEAPDPSVCPTVTDPAAREKWGLPPLR